MQKPPSLAMWMRKHMPACLHSRAAPGPAHARPCLSSFKVAHTCVNSLQLFTVKLKLLLRMMEKMPAAMADRLTHREKARNRGSSAPSSVLAFTHSQQPRRSGFLCLAWALSCACGVFVCLGEGGGKAFRFARDRHQGAVCQDGPQT